MAAAPDQYASALTSESRRQQENLCLDDLEEVMDEQWKQTNASTNKTESDEIGLTLFGGTCYNCQKTGHKANECPNKEKKKGYQGGYKGKSARFSGNCWSCGRLGHKAANCWREKRNTGKRPEWFKVKDTGR